MAYLVQCATLISQQAENNNNNKMVFRRDPHFTLAKTEVI